MTLDKWYAVLGIVVLSITGVIAAESRYAPMSAFAELDRGNLEERLLAAQDKLQDAKTPEERARYAERVRQWRQQLCGKYPESWLCQPSG